MARASKPTKRTQKAPMPPGGTADQQAEMKRQWLEQEEARAAERAKDIAARSKAASRPKLKTMKSGEYQLPPELREYLLRIGPTVSWKVKLFDADGSPYQERDVIEQANIIREAVHQAYVEGCLQGFIEGQLVYATTAQERSRNANAAKRSKPVVVDGQRMTLDQRDAAIVREFPALKAIVGSTEAQLRLAGKYNLESAKQIGNIIRKAKHP
jgi:hypothetical protein